VTGGARFSDHFSGHASQYATFRPTYPDELVDELARLAPARERAWDAATGNGQAALLLASRFSAVIATDASAQQLAHARAHPRVRYVRARSEDPALATASIDLVAVAQSLHWFDRPRFFDVTKRVLRPGGIVAAWCYTLARVDAAIDPIVDDFYERRVGRYWPPERVHVERLYRDFDFPFEELALAEPRMRAEFTRAQFLGYVATWSAVQRARQQEGVDPLEEFVRALAPIWPADERRVVRWPVGLRVGRWRA
jgi:SAM-dependent methyltransferase